MASPITPFDRVMETTTTTGSGAITLAGAVSGYQAFSAVVPTGSLIPYALVSVDANGNPLPSSCVWEVGFGTYTLSGTTLARTKVIASSSGTSAVTLPSGTTRVWIDFPAVYSEIDNGICQGRLTLTSGVPVTTSDVTSTSVYFTPYNGNRIALFDGTGWRKYQFTELTLALGTLTSGLPYDVFIYDNVGILTLESLAWTNGTTRTAAIAYQDGVPSKTGALTRRLLGTFYTISTTQTTDSVLQRFLSNVNNQVQRSLSLQETNNTWNYSSTSYQQANASTANQVEAIISLPGPMVSLLLNGICSTSDKTSSYSTSVAIGEDSTTTPVSGSVIANGLTPTNPSASPQITAFTNMSSSMDRLPTIGYHKYCWLESGAGTGTTSWYGYDGASPSLRRYGMVGHINGA